MAEKDFAEIMKILRNYFLGGLVALFFTIMTSMTVFYFNTKNKNMEQDKRLEILEKECAKKDNIDIKLNFISNQIQEIKEDIKDLKK